MILADTFFYLPDTVWQAIIAAVVTLVLARYARDAKTAADKADESAKKAEVKVQEVKNDLQAANYKADQKTEAIADVLDQVHQLTNSAMEIALTSVAVSARQVAVLTQDPRDEKRAQEAEKALEIHKQPGTETDG